MGKSKQVLQANEYSEVVNMINKMMYGKAPDAEKVTGEMVRKDGEGYKGVHAIYMRT